MPGTRCTRDVLPHPTDPTRLVRVRVERPDDDAVRPAVLVVHGFKGFMDWGFFPELSRRLAEAGLVAVSLNLSGSGIGEDPERFTEEEAFAKNTYSKEVEDLDLLRGHVEALPGVDAARLGVLGHSRGGGVTLLHAAARGDYRAVVTWAAIDDVDRVDEAGKAAWRERGFLEVPNARTGQVHRMDLDALRDVEEHREALDILAACARLQAPTLVVHGSADEAVPASAGQRIAAALPSALHLELDGAGHTFGATHPFAGAPPELEAVLDASTRFLVEHLG